jgi:hypothetical protein
MVVASMTLSTTIFCADTVLSFLLKQVEGGDGSAGDGQHMMQNDQRPQTAFFRAIQF